jgi:hypothetical protein
MPFRPQMEDRRMSPGNLILGCSVFLAVLGGLVASCLLVNAAIPPKISREMRAAAQEAAAKTGSKPLSDIADSSESPDGARSETPRLSGRWCVNFDGKTFGWDWANVPFGAAACGDPSQK